MRQPGAEPVTLEERCRAYATVMPHGMFFSHTTAAELYGLPLPKALCGVVHVAAARPRRAPRAAGIVGHRVTLEPDAVRDLAGLPVPPPVEVLCELAPMLDHDSLVQLGDALLRRTDPLTTAAELRETVDTAAGRPGIPRLRRALEAVRARTDSPMETMLRLAIVRAGLPEPHVNYRVDLGEHAVHLDLAYPDRRVAIEYDGDHHRTNARQFHLDVDRLWRIESGGWRIVRVNRSHLSAGATEAVTRIRLALATVGRNTPLSGW
jgi:very-short-patch-repair endonuclease